MADRVLVEILIAAPIETVWKALREPAEACRWFGWEYPTMAADIEMMWSDAKEDKANHVIYSDNMPDRFALEAAGDHTVLRVIRSAPANDNTWKGIYDDVFEGWQTFMHQLKFALERHATDTRKTIYLNGRAKQAGDANPVDALGLGSLWVVPIGDSYKVATATGDSLSGKIYYRGANQLGITVDEFGDGLLIAGIRPKTAKSAHGGGSILVTTYGMRPDAFTALRNRLSQWWGKVYEVIEIHPAA